MNLIVGGTGFIGGHLAEYFFEQAEISKGVFRKGSHLRIMDQSGIQCLEADLMDRSTLHEPLEGVEVVYSLASPTPKGGEDQDYVGPNIRGMTNLLAEAREHFGGYLVVDCESLERAVEIAARWPNARFCAMEVRPIMDPGGGDM